MDAEKWKALAGKLLSKDRAVKVLVLLGLCGIALICLSSLWGKAGREEPQRKPETSAGAEEYGEALEQDIARVVRAITGEEDPTVLVTLESGVRSVYAEDEKTGSREEETETSGEEERTHVILKDSDGAQRALTVTEIQPEIKGVVIVSRYAGDPAIREKLTQAVRTALNVSSARVCVTDTG